MQRHRTWKRLPPARQKADTTGGGRGSSLNSRSAYLVAICSDNETGTAFKNPAIDQGSPSPAPLLDPVMQEILSEWEVEESSDTGMIAPTASLDVSHQNTQYNENRSCTADSTCEKSLQAIQGNGNNDEPMCIPETTLVLPDAEDLGNSEPSRRITEIQLKLTEEFTASTSFPGISTEATTSKQNSEAFHHSDNESLFGDISDEDRTYIPEHDVCNTSTEEMSSEEISEPVLQDLTNVEIHPESTETSTPITRFQETSTETTTYEQTAEDFQRNEIQSAPTEANLGQKPYAIKIRKARTKALNTGQSYINVKGKLVPARVLKDLSLCRNQCHSKLLPEVRQSLFQDYWSLGSRDKRAAYIASLINTQPKKTIRLRDTRAESKKREVTHTYQFSINGERINVCKGCFCATLGETEKFVRIVIEKKKKSISSIPSPDRRGKTPSANKKPERVIDKVKSHILSFPAHESHYTRRTNDKKYLPSHLNLRIMYDLYRENVEGPVSRRIYETMFHSLKLSFKKPQQDTCHHCDTLDMKLKIAEGSRNEDEMIAIKSQKDQHLASADNAYVMKRNDKEEAKNNNSIKTYTFDLQQCLPTPFLVSSVAFYKRQLWTFNLTIHDGATGKAVNYMWHEAVAGRGANEIASCLYHFLLHKVPPTVTQVTFYSDTCGGQNKNSHVAAMFLKVIEESTHLKVINHKFLIPGHTHMECDVDHALIEKQKKKSKMPIYHPHDWFQLVRLTGKKIPFEVHEMGRNDFYPFSELLSNQLVARKQNVEREPFKWHDFKWLQYQSESPRCLFYKTELHQDLFKVINLKRQGRRGMQSLTGLRHYDDAGNPISVEKKNDLMELLPLIPPVFHNFYKNLPTRPNLQDQDPDLIDSEED